MGVLLPETEEEQHRKMITWLGWALIVGFIFPIYFSMMGFSKIFFLNIALMGKGSFLLTLILLYPLIAGILVLVIGLNVQQPMGSLGILGIGIFSFVLLILGLNQLMSFVTGAGPFMKPGLAAYNVKIIIPFMICFSLIGMYVGSKIVSLTDHISGRLLGGISGIVFLVLILLPVTGDIPHYFELFSLLKSGSRLGVGGSMKLMGILLIAIYTCYIFAAVIDIINISCRPNSEQTADNARKMVLYSTLAIPFSLLVGFLSASSGYGFGVVFSVVVKVSLWFGGFFVATALGLMGFIDQYLPRTVKGGELLNRGDNSQNFDNREFPTAHSPYSNR